MRFVIIGILLFASLVILFWRWQKTTSQSLTQQHAENDSAEMENALIEVELGGSSSNHQDDDVSKLTDNVSRCASL